MKLDNAHFLVTGAASGLGQGVVQALVNKGARCVMIDINDTAGSRIMHKDTTGRILWPGPIDITSEDQVLKAIHQAVDRFGPLTGAINCGGIVHAGKVVEKGGKPMSLESFTKTLHVNTIGTFNVCRLVASHLSTQVPSNPDGERGVLINVASVAYQDGQVGQAAYSASKGAVASMTLPMARELAKHGIRVCTIAPGLFETPMMAISNERVMAALAKDLVFPQRLGRPAEFAQLVLHVIENPMFNGEVIRLDGSVRLSKL